MSVEQQTINLSGENKVGNTDLSCLWWLHALEEYIETDTLVGEGLQTNIADLLERNIVDNCWIMVCDGAPDEVMPHFVHMSVIGEPGNNIDADFPIATHIELDYSQFITTDGPQTSNTGSISVIVRLPCDKISEQGELIANAILVEYQKQMADLYPDMTVDYDANGPKLIDR